MSEEVSTVIQNHIIPKKKVHIETWGCQMNVADSERMLAILKQKNYETCETAEEADLVLLNTCHIREKAKQKVLSRLGRIKAMKENKKDMKIAVAGCVVQAESKKLMKQLPFVDFMVGPGQIDRIGSLVEHPNRQVAVGFKPVDPKEVLNVPDSNPTVTGKSEITRYVNIMQGCDNFCTFCVVPRTRGREVSRTPNEVLTECRSLVENGAKEITLLGQNVNSYGNDLVRDGKLDVDYNGEAFVDLLDQVSQIEGLKRLRFTTSNPHDFTPQLAKLFPLRSKLGEYIHLPVQSGDNTVLERMRRKVTREEFFERVSWLRNEVPDMAISTDLIVGFPGETREQFEATISLVEQVRFSFIFSFKYSPRSLTAAARFEEQVSEEEKSYRLRRLNEVQDRITVEWNKAQIGKTKSVLFLYESRKEPNCYYGRTQQFRLVKVHAGRNVIGQELPVEIINSNKIALEGRLSN